jgi:Right handed beta helix region
MKVFNCKTYIAAFGLLLLMGSTAHATMLYVNCGGKAGLSSIGAALKILQSPLFSAPNTINVSGACNENVVIQSIDRLTLTAVKGASINDPSGGNLVTVTIDDSRDVAINGFVINGGVGGADGIDCQDGSVCRLNSNIIQGAMNGYGVGVFFSQVFLDGGTLQNNNTGLGAINGASAKATNVMIQNNSANGIEIRGQSLLNTTATITANTASGVYVHESGVLYCQGCQITGNGGIGLILRRDSSARLYSTYAVTGNTGGGILLTEESSAYFASVGTVTGNTGGMDVFCGSSYTTAKFATTNIGGGTTNCVEPSP